MSPDTPTYDLNEVHAKLERFIKIEETYQSIKSDRNAARKELVKWFPTELRGIPVVFSFIGRTYAVTVRKVSIKVTLAKNIT